MTLFEGLENNCYKSIYIAKIIVAVCNGDLYICVDFYTLIKLSRNNEMLAFTLFELLLYPKLNLFTLLFKLMFKYLHSL